MSNKIWVIYKIVFPNGKNYIGLTCDFSKRKCAHKRDFKKGEHRPLYTAMKHFGWDNAVFEIIHKDIPSLEEANELEKYYIKMYLSKIEHNGYNCSDGGDGAPGVKQSPEKIKQFIEQSKERWKDPEYRNMMLGLDRTVSAETRSKMSKSKKKLWAEKGHSWTGRNHKPESRNKMKGPRPNCKYDLASYYRGKRLYCPDLDVVFFSVKHYADYMGISKPKAHYRVKSKYHSITYYKE